MDFTIDPSLITHKRAIEALDDNIRVVNVEDETMKIRLINDNIIEFNELKSVDDPIMFERGNIPRVGGLFSEYIFGITTEERMKNFGYINLKKKFIHPFAYEILKKLYKNINKVCSGMSSWHINEAGKLIEIKDVDDPLYNEDNSGLTWFIENYHKIIFDYNESIVRKDRLSFIKLLRDEDIFITKWLVIPVFYRDVDKSTGRDSIPEINYSYQDIIRYVSAVSNDDFGFFNNRAMYNIQMELIKIRRLGQSLIEKKNGIFHKSILGKSIDYGARLVISVPTMNNAERPEELQVDMLHTGIPLVYCIVLGYPFMIKWCLDFFEAEFNNTSKKTVAVYNNKTNTYTTEEVEIVDQMTLFTKEYIDKMMNLYKNTYSVRFDPIMITLANGKKMPLYFKGRGISSPHDPMAANPIINRPMTWTDLFYLAAEETLSDKYVYSTRYPLVDYFGTYPSKCRPLSTIKTQPAMINGKIYPFYPVVEFNLPDKEIPSRFRDTAEISNLYLSAIGGDYDGDQISIKMLYTIEANKEAEKLMGSLKHFISTQGDIIRTIGTEGVLTFYNMTKY